METSGEYNLNPLLNTQVYEVKDPYGNVIPYAANIIAENVYKTCDDDGYRWLTVTEIVGHNQADNAVQKEDQ